MVKRRSVVILLFLGALLLYNLVNVLLKSGKRDGSAFTSGENVSQMKEKSQKKKIRYFTTGASVFVRRMGHKYERRLPKILGIGVKKCGTTALFRFLSLHSQIVLPQKPELHFFDTSEFLKGQGYYRKLMPFTTPDELAAEKSPRYFVLKDVPSKVKSLLPSVKLLVVVCDPVRRAYSDFTFESHRDTKRLLKVQKTAPFYSGFDEFINVVMEKILPLQKNSEKRFNEFVLNSWSPNSYYLTILNTGLYSIYLKNWIKYFPLNQIHVVNGEDLISNPVQVMRKVQQFLGLDIKVDERDIVFDEQKGYHCIKKYRRDDLVQCMADTKGTTRNKTTSEMMTKDTLKVLKKFYQRYNEELFEILGTRFEWT